MECKCDNGSIEDAGAWLSGKNTQMGAFAVVGYLLYRFSQTLPALIRWPIRVFCSLTGLSALWSWVSRLVGTLRVIRNLCKWLAKMWKLLKASSSKFHWIVPIITGSSPGSWDGHKMDLSNPLHTGLRVIVVGPAGGGRTSVADLLLGRDQEPPPRPLAESVLSRSIVDGRELVVVDTPDLLGASLGRTQRAREALKSLRLAAPGPHAVLLVMPTSGEGTYQEAAARGVLELLGDDVRGYVVPVLTRGERRRQDTGATKKLAAVCGQSPELLDAAAADGSPEERGATRRALVGRVLEMKGLKGHFVHELQRRDERLRTELLDDMTSALGQKLNK
ncbi:GTPase IMAP family member 1-like [Stigmatopora nigra]